MMKNRRKVKNKELLKSPYNPKTKPIFALLKLLSFQNHKFTLITKYSMNYLHLHLLKINQSLFKTSFHDPYSSPNLQ
jgi:hypothetical protein